MSKLVSKIKSLPAGVKATVAFFLASLMTKGIAYICTPIYVGLLSEAQMGQVSLFLTWLDIFGIVAMFCLSYGVFNNGMVDYPEKRSEFSFSLLVLSNIITIGFSIALLALYPLINEFIGLDFSMLVLMCIIFVFQPAYSFWTARQRYELKYKKTVFWTIVSSLLSPVIAIVCILLTPDESKLYARIFGAEIVLIAIYIGFYVFLAKKSKFKVNVKYWKSAFLFNLPLIPHYLSTYLLGNSNKLLIKYIIGEEAVAYYSVAFSVAAIATIVWSAINTSLIPYTYENCKKKTYGNIDKVTLPILTLFAVACLVVIMMAPEVMWVMTLGKSSYMEAIYVIPPVVGGVFFQVQYYVYANVVYYYKKPKYVMIASVSATVINIVLGYFCISRWGYLAAGYVTLACYFLQATLDYLALRHVVKTKIYNMKYVGALSLAVIVVALGSNLLYAQPILRYGVIALVLIVLILMRKKLIALIKKIMGKDKSERKAEEKANSEEITAQSTIDQSQAQSSQPDYKKEETEENVLPQQDEK